MSTEKTDNFIPRLFLHFLDLYHYRLAKYVFKYPIELIFAELRLAFRLSFLLSREVYVPGSAYFENPITRKILKEHLEICEMGFVYITANDPSLFDHFDRKRTVHFDKNSPSEILSSYRRIPNIPILYRSENIKTSHFITKNWYDILNSGHLISFLNPYGNVKYPKNYEEVWQKVPDVLEKRAFVASHVMDSFRKLGVDPPSELTLLKVLDPSFTISHTEPLRSGLIDDLLYIQLPWSIDSGYAGFSYQNVKRMLTYYDLLTLIKSSTCHSLIRLKLSSIWSQFVPHLLSGEIKQDHEVYQLLNDVKKFLLSNEMISDTVPKKSDTMRIGVITALPEEWLAVTTCLDAQEVDQIENDPNRYAFASLKIGNDISSRTLDIVITFLPRMGTNSAATVTTNLLRSFPSIDSLIFSGIGCGCPYPSDPDKHVRLGDIVVSDLRGIVQFDNQAIKDGKIENRSNMPLPSRELLNSVRLLQADEMEEVYIWNNIIDQLIEKNKIFKKPPATSDVLVDEEGLAIKHPKDAKRNHKYPRVFQGTIGSSNTLLRDRKLRHRLSKEYNLRAIEMEGAGTAEAVWHFGKNYLIIRGVCDYGDSLKTDRWHYYAAAVAAAYTKAILIRLSK